MAVVTTLAVQRDAAKGLETLEGIKGQHRSRLRLEVLYAIDWYSNSFMSGERYDTAVSGLSLSKYFLRVQVFQVHRVVKS